MSLLEILEGVNQLSYKALGAIVNSCIERDRDFFSKELKSYKTDKHKQLLKIIVRVKFYAFVLHC